MKKNLPNFFFDAYLCPRTPHSLVSSEIFPGGEKRQFAYPFQVAGNATQVDVHKTFYPVCATKQMPNVTATIANSAPSKKTYAKLMLVLVSMNILILKSEFAEF